MTVASLELEQGLTELCGELETLGERCTVTRAIASCSSSSSRSSSSSSSRATAPRCCTLSLTTTTRMVERGLDDDEAFGEGGHTRTRDGWTHAHGVRGSGRQEHRDAMLIFRAHRTASRSGPPSFHIHTSTHVSVCVYVRRRLVLLHDG